MSAWWQDLSPRERLLINITGALAIILLMSLGVLRPLGEWRNDAANKAQQARDGYELSAAAATVAGAGLSTDTRADAPLRQAVLQTAGAASIELVRIGSEQNGQIEIQLAPTSGDRLFAWLAELETRHGVTVAFADMTTGGTGNVNPQVLVFEQR